MSERPTESKPDGRKPGLIKGAMNKVLTFESFFGISKAEMKLRRKEAREEEAREKAEHERGAWEPIG